MAVSHDLSRHEWVVIRTDLDNGHIARTRMVLQCKEVYGPHGWDGDPDSCFLPIGQLVIPNLSPAKGHESEKVVIDRTEEDHEIRIYQGPDDHLLGQAFIIEKEELLSER